MIAIPQSPGFAELVADVEVQARLHPGQAKRTVLVAFGGPFLDRFEHGMLDRALLRVQEARNEGEVRAAAGLLARALEMVQARSQNRKAS